MTSVIQLTKTLQEPPEVIEIKDFTVRSFAPEDVIPWLELRHRAFARESHGVREWTPADFEREFCQRWWWNPRNMWVAEWKTVAGPTKLAASVTLAMRGEPASALPVVHWLMVAPEARRRGLGKLLLAHLERAAWELGYREVRLETHAAWRAATRLYESQGFLPAEQDRAR